MTYFNPPSGKLQLDLKGLNVSTHRPKKHRLSCLFNQPPKPIILASFQPHFSHSFRPPQVVFLRYIWKKSTNLLKQQPWIRTRQQASSNMTPTQTSCIFEGAKNSLKNYNQHHLHQVWPLLEWVPEKWRLTIPGLPVTALMHGPSKIHQAVAGAMQRLLGKEKRRKEDGRLQGAGFV